MKVGPKIDNYKKFQFYTFLENVMLALVSYEVNSFKTIKNITIFINSFFSIEML